MTKPTQKIVLLTSGGDAPGMNAAIRAAVRCAIHYGMEVYSSETGFYGLVNQQLKMLNPRSVANCIQRGGTILKTGRCEEFRDKSTRDAVRAFLQTEGIDALIILGGNGSFAGATLLHEEGGPNVIGIPCTIDNDISGTEYCIGFDTACNTALEAIDKIRDTAFSLDRNFLIEVMGRNSGFIAVNVGIAGGAEMILIPEFPVTVEQLATRIQRKSNKKLASIIVAAEANQAGRSFKIAKEIKEKTGVKYRVCVLGHTQRGGVPTNKDRVMGSLMGAKAVDAIKQGFSKKMVAVNNGKIDLSDFPNPECATRYFDDQALLQMNEIICEIVS